MSKMLKRNGYHSILRYDPLENKYSGTIEEFGSEATFQFGAADIEEAVRRFDENVDRISDETLCKPIQTYLPSAFETKRHHSLLYHLLLYGILWLLVASGAQLLLRFVFKEERLFTLSIYILGMVVLWAAINIFSSRYFYELFLQIRPYYWFYGENEKYDYAYTWYKKKAGDTFRFFYEGKPTRLFWTTGVAMTGGLIFYIVFTVLEGQVFASPFCNLFLLPALILVAMFFAGSSLWPMCSFFNIFFIDKTFAFRYSKVRFMNDEDLATVFEIKKFFIYFSIVATFAYMQLLAGCWFTGIVMQTRLALICFFAGSFFPLGMYCCALGFFKKLVDNVGISHISELDLVIEQNYSQFINAKESDCNSYEKVSQAIELKKIYYNSLKSHTTLDVGAILTTAVSILSGLIAIIQVVMSS